MPLTGIQSVSIYVNDLDQAIDFYTNKLGFDKNDDVPLYEGSDLRWVTVSPPGSGTQIVLVKGYADWTSERVGTWTGLVFGVENIVDTFKQMETHGVEIIEKPSPQMWGMQAQFKDQDGNAFVVVGQ